MAKKRFFIWDIPEDTHVITISKDGGDAKATYGFKSERLAQDQFGVWELPNKMEGTVIRKGNVLTQVTDRGTYIFTIEEI